MRTCLVTAALFAVMTPALASSYSNARFEYEFDYPSGLFAAQPEADNGDGRHFTALQGHADIAVWGSYNALDQSPNDIATETSAECVDAPYELVKPTVVVVSCSTKSGVVYRKTYIRGDALTAFEIDYPAAEKARWEAVIAKLKLHPVK